MSHISIEPLKEKFHLVRNKYTGCPVREARYVCSKFFEQICEEIASNNTSSKPLSSKLIKDSLGLMAQKYDEFPKLFDSLAITFIRNLENHPKLITEGVKIFAKSFNKEEATVLDFFQKKVKVFLNRSKTKKAWEKVIETLNKYNPKGNTPSSVPPQDSVIGTGEQKQTGPTTSLT